MLLPGTYRLEHTLTCWIDSFYTQTLPSCLSLWGSQSTHSERRQREGGWERGREGRERGEGIIGGRGGSEGGREGLSQSQIWHKLKPLSLFFPVLEKGGHIILHALR